VMVAADFFTVEVWTRRGLERFLVLFFNRLVDAKGGDRGSGAGSQWIVDEPDHP